MKWLVRHINALKGTVEAQGRTLETVGKLNEALIKVFTALDPERWAKEVEVHKRLADQKVEALLAEGQRKFEEEKKALTGRSSEALDAAVNGWPASLTAAFRLLAYIPRNLRATIIRDMPIPGWLRGNLLQAADEFPELRTPLELKGLADILAESGPIPGVDPKTSGMNVRPPGDT